MALEGPHIARKQAESNRAAPVPVVDAVDEWREFLATVVVGGEQIRLMMAGRYQVEQHDADRQRLIARHPRPQLLKARKQKAGVARFEEGDFIPSAAEIAGPGKMQA
jgi:hypothetical protein